MLMAERQTTPAKGRNPRHQQSRSVSHTSIFTNPGASPHSAQKPRNHNHGSNRKNQPAPAWDAPLSTITGDFDAEGKFVESGTETNTETEEGVVFSGRQQRGPRRGKPKHPSGNIAYTQQIAADGRTGSPRYAQQPAQQQVYQQVHQPVTQPTATPAKGAYAGPAFHASPAPSSIPIPKFYSKSVPSSSSQPGLQARLEAEENNDSPPMATLAPSQSDPATLLPGRQVTPLDMLFKADRAEKEKERSGSGSQTPQGKPSQSQSAVRTEPAPVRVWSDIYGSNQRHHQRNASGGGMFNMDMDNEKPANRNSGYTSDQYGNRSKTSPVQAHSAAQNKTHSKGVLNSIQDSPQRTPPYGQPGMPQGFHSPSPFYQPPAQSLSGPTTPVHRGQTQESSLHYGNKNLSPLFHAAKNGNPKRMSGLRQEAQYSGPPISHTPPTTTSGSGNQAAYGTPPHGASDRDPNVKNLEDSLRKMLNIPGS